MDSASSRRQGLLPMSKDRNGANIRTREQSRCALASGAELGRQVSGDIVKMKSRFEEDGDEAAVIGSQVCRTDR